MAPASMIARQTSDDALKDPVTTTKALLLHIVAPRTLVNPAAEKKKKSHTLGTLSESKSDDQQSIELLGSASMSSDAPPRLLTRDYSQDVTQEEAAAINSDDPFAGTIVNMEELLRINFRRLALEWHLLNVPTYSLVSHLNKMVVGKPGDDDESNSEDDDRNHHIQMKESGENISVDDDDKRDDDAWIQISAMVRPSSLEIVLGRLERIGVGSMCGTVTVLKAELCRTASPLAQGLPDAAALTPQHSTDMGYSTAGTVNTNPKLMAKERASEAARQEWKSAATRLRIEQLREQIVEQAAMSLDFIALVTIASILAGIGLITNNTVVIVASMLVSPIMGPVLGLTFGTQICDGPLVRLSLRNEILALVGCVVIGMLVGLSAAFTSLASNEWPTTEMQIRGEPLGLITGIAIALPSGMGVCLSILGGNTSSLVGVAISASLLPPAVNTGVCLVYALLLHTKAVEGADVRTFAEIGVISFALTVVNILCIWAAGLIMFQIKEVAPVQQKNAFWTRGLRVARNLNRDSSKPLPHVVQFPRNRSKRLQRRRRREHTDLSAAFVTSTSQRNNFSASTWDTSVVTDAGEANAEEEEEEREGAVRYNMGLEGMATAAPSTPYVLI